MCSVFFHYATWSDIGQGVSQHPKGTTTNNQSSSLAYLVSVCSATERDLQLPTAPSGTVPLPSFKSQLSGAGGERAETARGVEVEEEGRERRDGMLQGWAPGLSPAAWECVIQAARSDASSSQA